MKTILVMPDGNWLSHVSRPLAIAKILRKMGFRVLFAGSGEYMKLPRSDGFDVVDLFSISADRTLEVCRRGSANYYHYHLACKCVEEEIRLFNELRPDMVLNDFRLTLSTSCEIMHIPMVVTLNAACTNYYAVRTRCPEHFPVTRFVGQHIGDFFAPPVKQFLWWFDALPLNRVRKKYRLSPRKNIMDIWRGDLNLIVDIPEYGPTHELPDNFHYIGPITWEPDIEMPQSFYTIDRSQPCIYFTMGSTGFARFFHQAIDLFAHTDYQCIMTTAGMVHIDSAPRNFRVYDYAPGSKIMQIADAVVCHGGNGTIYQALSAGVPIIGIPTMHDQEFNLDRVVALGAGIHLSERRFVPRDLLNAVKDVLHKPLYKEAARKCATILGPYNAPQKGAELIREFLEV